MLAGLGIRTNMGLRRRNFSAPGVFQFIGATIGMTGSTAHQLRRTLQGLLAPVRLTLNGHHLAAMREQTHPNQPRLRKQPPRQHRPGRQVARVQRVVKLLKLGADHVHRV